MRDRLADVTPQLPPEVTAPNFEDLKDRGFTLIAALTWKLDSPPNYAILNRLAEELEHEPGICSSRGNFVRQCYPGHGGRM